MFQLNHYSLKLKMLLSAVFVGLFVWAITDAIQNYSLQKIFDSKLAERFSLQAEKQRIMFDRYVKNHHQAVKLFVDSHKIRSYIDSPSWQPRKKGLTYNTPPPWLPSLSVMRNIIQPRYLLLLDNDGFCRELYKADSEAAPITLRKPVASLLNLSHGQGYLTNLDGKPYLLASEKILNEQGDTQATLLLVSPLDEEFLIASQASILADSNVIALLSENDQSILVSSNSSLIPSGTTIESLKESYLTIGQGFFDYGATDITIELISFISKAEASQLTQDVLNEERPIWGLTALIYILSFILLIFYITRRLQRFTNYVVGFSDRMNLKNIKQTTSGDEINILEENFNRLAEAVQTENQLLTHQALHDPLTDLPNRKLLHNRLEQEILRGERNSNNLILIMTDLNRFKEINDTLGHHIGDLVLQQTGERLSYIFRKTDTIARLGGDEFAMLLPDTSLEQAKILTQKVLDDFNNPFIVDGHTLNVDISIGLVEYPTHGDSVDVLMQHADVAMYVAKEKKSGYDIYDSNKDTHQIGRLTLMSELRDAIENESLEMYYQPKVKMDTGEVVGVEALLRWNHPQRGFIQPDEIIPLAEQTGLIKPLTQWILERAIKQCANWKARNLTLAINISIHNIHDINFLTNIKKTMDERFLSPENLILEISESDIMSEPLRARQILEKINETGIKLSVDNYGTGFSSLSYIKKSPIDEIKIDRSFVLEMTKDKDDETVVLATIDLAHNLGLEIVAEGVHDKNIWDKLRTHNCDYAQGHYICEPLSAADFSLWLKNNDRKNKTSSLL